MSCINPTYCVNTGVYPYDGEYNFAGTFNSEDYFTGGSYFIYYSTTENKWCLSDSLGGSCYQFGPLNSGSNCPDLDVGFFSVGSCPTTTTTTTSPCDVFDFEALFDCIIPPTTTTTTTAPPTTTTTTTIFNPCLSGDVKFDVVESSTTTTTTAPPTTTTTTTVNRPCNFDGTVQFNIFDQYMRCGNSKLFRDCLTGLNFYTSDLILAPYGLPPVQDYVYKADVNGVSTCVTFLGLIDNISGIDEIILIDEVGPEIDGACLDCIPDPQPTTTTTSTSTTTTTTTLPCVEQKYRVQNNSPVPQIVTYETCKGPVSTQIPRAGEFPNNTIVVCSTSVPVPNDPISVSVSAPVGPC